MKSIYLRQFIAFITIVLSAVCAFPQTQVPAKSGVEGYRGFVDLGGEALFQKKYSDDRDIVYSISGFTTTHGYQFNGHFFAGAGMGISFFTYNFRSAAFGIGYPVYAAGRVDWKVGKVPLFADLRVGTFLNSIRREFDRVFFNPSAGYHCSWGRKVSLNIGAGVSLHCLDMEQGRRWKFMPSVRIGIEFR